MKPVEFMRVRCGACGCERVKQQSTRGRVRHYRCLACGGHFKATQREQPDGKPDVCRPGPTPPASAPRTALYSRDMVVIRDPSHRYEFAIAAEDHDPAGTLFILAPLTGRQEAALMNAVASSSESSGRAATLISEAARMACRTWQNLGSASGPVEFLAVPRQRILSVEVLDACDLELWESLPYGVRKAIGEHVISRAVIGA